MTGDHLHVLTERLDLRRTEPATDLDALFPIFSDPDGCWYDPDGRHTTRARTEMCLSRAAQRFDEDGLSYWSVRTELGRAARAAASAVDAAVPFIAWVAPHNTPSVRVAERLGLTSHGLHADPSDGQLPLAYADRSLDAGDWYADSATRRARETR